MLVPGRPGPRQCWWRQCPSLSLWHDIQVPQSPIYVDVYPASTPPIIHTSTAFANQVWNCVIIIRFGVTCFEMMTQGQLPYREWMNWYVTIHVLDLMRMRQ